MIIVENSAEWRLSLPPKCHTELEMPDCIRLADNTHLDIRPFYFYYFLVAPACVAHKVIYKQEEYVHVGTSQETRKSMMDTCKRLSTFVWRAYCC